MNFDFLWRRNFTLTEITCTWYFQWLNGKKISCFHTVTNYLNSVYFSRMNPMPNGSSNYWIVSRTNGRCYGLRIMVFSSCDRVFVFSIKGRRKIYSSLYVKKRFVHKNQRVSVCYSSKEKCSLTKDFLLLIMKSVGNKAVRPGIKLALCTLNSIQIQDHS